MNVTGVDRLLSQMQSIAGMAHGGGMASGGVRSPASVDFASVLKSSLDQVAGMQSKSEDMQKAFVLGDDKVSLSDTMITMQKAGVAFQTTIQVRNKVVAAYNDIMNMQV